MSEETNDVASSPEIHFEPIVNLPLVEIKTLEENEDVLFQMRARLYRFESAGDPAEWKERGTGEVKLLRDRKKDHVRVLMRRDKTHKICANHYVAPYMELKPMASSDRAWVWSVLADFADEEPKPELLAIKFANACNAEKFKEAFNEAKAIVSRLEDKSETTVSESDLDESQNADESKTEDETDEKSKTEGDAEKEVTEKISTLTVHEDDKENTPTKEEEIKSDLDKENRKD